MRARRTDADGHSVHLKAFVVQLFQHNFSCKVTILRVKRIEVQKVYFAPSKRQLKRQFLTGYFHFGILSRIGNRFKFNCFHVVIFLSRKETEHNYVKTGPANLFQMENGSSHLFPSLKIQKESGITVISIYGSILSPINVRSPS